MSAFRRWPDDVSLPWYRRFWLGCEVGPTGANPHDEVFNARMTGRDIVEKVRLARAEYVVLFLKDQTFAYYDSKVSRKCPTLGDRDLLREVLAEAVPHGIPVIAYCQVQYDAATWTDHPDWRMQDPQGNDIRHRLCYTSAYLAHVKASLAEMMAYDIVGFHVDMLDFGFGPPYGCWCGRCRSKFQETYGIPMPEGVTWDDAWEKMLLFRGDSNTAFCRDIEAFVHGQRPELSVDFNWHGYPPFSWEAGERPVQHAANGDFVTAEGLPWVFGHTNPSLISLFMAGARPSGPLQIATSRSVYNYHDFTVRPTADMKWEVYTYLAHGIQCTMVDKANYDGSLDRVAFARLGEIYGEAAGRYDYFGHQPVPEVGLYYSTRTRDWYGRTDPPKYQAAVVGAHKALLQSHLPMGVIVDDNATPEVLRHYPVVYAPNAACLSADEVALLRDYVAGGGNLLTTGLTGVCDRYGQPTAISALADVIGAELVAVQSEFPDNYLRLPAPRDDDEATLTRDVPPDWDLLTWGPIAAVRPTTARAFGEVLVAHRSRDNQWSKLMSADRPIGPAILINQLGLGRVIHVPCSLDAAWAGEYRSPEHRFLIRNLIRYLNPNPAVAVDAPLNTEIVVTRDAECGRLLIHFLTFSAPPTHAATAFPTGRRVLPPVMEEPLRFTAQVTVRAPFGQASRVGPGAPPHRRGNTITIDVSDVHEVLVVEPE